MTDSFVLRARALLGSPLRNPTHILSWMNERMNGVTGCGKITGPARGGERLVVTLQAAEPWLLGREASPAFHTCPVYAAPVLRQLPGF